MAPNWVYFSGSSIARLLTARQNVAMALEHDSSGVAKPTVCVARPIY